RGQGLCRLRAAVRGAAHDLRPCRRRRACRLLALHRRSRQRLHARRHARLVAQRHALSAAGAGGSTLRRMPLGSPNDHRPRTGVLRTLWRVLRAILLALAAVILAIEEWGWRPLTAWAG